MAAIMRVLKLGAAGAMLSSLLGVAGCSRMSTENLEIDPEQFNVNNDSPEIADAGRLQVDPDQVNVNENSL